MLRYTLLAVGTALRKGGSVSNPRSGPIIARNGPGHRPASSYERLFRSAPVGYSPAFCMTFPRTLIFLHIPKTGGTTFRRILAGNYSRDETLTFDGADYSVAMERFAQSSEVSRARYRAIQGHLYFGFHRLVPGESSYVTWIRDPIARALSFYSHVRTHPEHYLHRRLIDERLDLKGLIEGEVTPELFNLQTRMVAGARNHPVSGLDRTTLEIAKENLEKNFCFVGLTEEFDAGITLLSAMLGWNIPFYVKRNVSSERTAAESVDPKINRLLREANLFDFELYEFARNLFEARRRAAGPMFESQLSQFQRLNSVAASARGHYSKMKAAFKNSVMLRGSRQPVALKENPAEPSV